jgi:SAM-dependent methyltransferase
LAYARGLVLDVGCADRWACDRLPAGCDYVGIDYPHTGLELYGARPDCLADAARLPIADGVVDTVLLLDVLEHLRHPNEALAECARVLRPGGRLLLAVPFLYPIHDAPHDFQRLTEYGLARDVRATGLEVESSIVDASAIESAGLLMNLALAGTVYECWRRRSPWLLVAPMLLFPIPLVNVICWLVGRLLPGWTAMTPGYAVVARKP